MSYDGTLGTIHEASLRQEAMNSVVDRMISDKQKQQIAQLMQRGMTMRKAKRAIGFTKKNPIKNLFKK